MMTMMIMMKMHDIKPRHSTSEYRYGVIYIEIQVIHTNHRENKSNVQITNYMTGIHLNKHKGK